MANREAEELEASVPKRFSSFIVDVPVQQDGEGDPSPDNVRYITQWSKVDAFVADSISEDTPVATVELPSPIYGGRIDVVRGEVASTYNVKMNATGWEMVEEGQFRCLVSAYNNGDETSTNVADLYSSHYKTVSNKDAYDGTDDLTCGLATIDGITYLYANDADYTTLEAFTAYVGVVMFVYKAHIPMSDTVDPQIIFLPEGTSYVWATGVEVVADVVIELVGNAAPIVRYFPHNSVATECNVSFTPSQDLHGYANPWPAGGGVNKINYLSCIGIGARDGTDSIYYDNVSISGTELTINQSYGSNGGILKGVGTFPLATGEYVTISGKATLVGTSELTVGIANYNGGGTNNIRQYVTLTDGKFSVTLDAKSDYSKTGIFLQPSTVGSTAVVSEVMVALGQTEQSYSPYSNLCPISGWQGADVYIEPTYDPTATPKASVTFGVQSANQWDEEWEVGTISGSDGQNESADNRIRSKNYIPVKHNTQYRIIGTMDLFYYDANKAYIGNVTGASNITFTTSENSSFIRFRLPTTYGTTYNHDIAINLPSTVTTYNPYRNYILGGTAEIVSGTGSGAWITFTLNGTQTRNNQKLDGAYNAVARWDLPVQAKAFTPGVPPYLCESLRAVSSTLIGSFQSWSDSESHAYTFTFSDDGRRVGIAIPKSVGISTAAELDTWLSNNPITFCYEVATPTTYTFPPASNELTIQKNKNYLWATMT